MQFTLHDIAIAEENIKEDKDRKYQTDILSYNEFVRYFNNIEEINIHNFIIGVHFVYGWMPTILKLHINNDDHISDILNILNDAKREKRISEDNIILLWVHRS